ncbi:MAG: hypothetical protein QXK89_02280 [Candidatus Bathyarchaeia archaeon]|nr:hypothetical protein [Candidatus Bathyarchaeota archaeon]
MRLSKKKVVLSVIVLLLAGISIVGWLFLSQQPQEGFGIYLESNKLVISDEDIVSYNKTSHEIKLTARGVEKIKALKVPMTGSPFVIKINGKEIYNGSFWVSLSSLSYSGIVIDTLKIQDNTIKIEKGYPSPEFFKGSDPRNNSEIFDYFQKKGKLIH